MNTLWSVIHWPFWEEHVRDFWIATHRCEITKAGKPTRQQLDNLTWHCQNRAYHARTS